MKNMKKKIDELMDQLKHDPKAKCTGQYDSGSSDEDDHQDDEHMKAIKAKAQKKGQRAGVSAEVYG
jgi:hypothetical protein